MPDKGFLKWVDDSGVALEYTDEGRVIVSTDDIYITLPLNELRDFLEEIDADSAMPPGGLQPLQQYYEFKVHRPARLTGKARQKILARLKSFKTEDLIASIDGFSDDEWQMAHNRHRGLAWFFHSDDRTEEFLNLLKAPLQHEAVDESKCPHCKRTMAKKLFPEGSNIDRRWWDQPVLHCDGCHYCRAVSAEKTALAS